MTATPDATTQQQAMNPAMRQEVIASLLQRDGPQQRSTLANHFSVSEKTIRRDIQALQQAGAPIVLDPEVGYVWRLTMDNQDRGTHRITGRVIDGKYGGVPGLRVRAYDQDLLAYDNFLGEGETASNGVFDFTIGGTEAIELLEATLGQDLLFVRVEAGDDIVASGRAIGQWDRNARVFTINDILVPSSVRFRMQTAAQTESRVVATNEAVPGALENIATILRDATKEAADRDRQREAAQAARDAKRDAEQAAREAAQVRRDAERDAEFERRGREVQYTIDDIAAYMPTASPGPAAFAGASTLGWSEAEDPLDSPINRAFASVLGSDLDVNKPTAVIDRLNHVFKQTVVDGDIEYVWQPQPNYTVQTTNGTVLTGALASFNQLVDSSLSTAETLFMLVKPLVPTIAQHKADAEIAVLRNLLKTLRAVLQAQLPPQQRVEGLFKSIDQQLNRIRDDFGLRRANIVTTDDEQVFASYRVGRSAVDKLRETFGQLRDEFGGTPKFLGSQVVLLSNALSSLADTVDMAVSAMTALGYGPLEQRSLLLPLPEGRRGTAPISFDGLMSWIRSFASESKLLIDSGGTRGVMAIIPDAQELSELVKAAASVNPEVHRALRHPRIRRIMESLRLQLDDVVELAEGIVV